MRLMLRAWRLAAAPARPVHAVTTVDAGVPRPFQSAVTAALPALVLLVLTPANIYIGNQPHFDHNFVVVLHLCFVYAVVTLSLYLLFRAAPGLCRWVAYPAGVLGALMLGVSMFSPSPVDELLGGGIRDIELSTGALLIDAGLIIALAVLVTLVPAPKIIDITCVFSLLAAVAAPATVMFEARRADESVVAWLRDAPAPPDASIDRPNIYHLVFDGFDATLFERLVPELGLEANLAGFVWYPNALSNYTSTRLSFPSFMTGRIFDESVTDETGGRIGRREGLVKSLAEIGYTVTQYNGYYLNNHARAHVRRSTAELDAALFGRLRQLVQLLDLSILLATPSVLKPYTALDGRGLVGHWALRGPRSLADWTRNPPVLSRMLFDRMLEDEGQRPARGQYVNGHFLIPHSPFVLSARCEYQPSRTKSLVTLTAQSMCTIAKLTELVDRLRALDRLEDAMVVVHADHGTMRRDRPLLLVKPPGRSDEKLEVARQVVQLADIAPTIHKAVGLDVAGFDGRPLDETKGVDREIKVFIANPALVD